MPEKILEIRNIEKSFAGNKALDKVNVTIYAGEIHALLGENGAGKSTLIKILAGKYRADGGTIIYQGKDIGLDVDQISLSVVHQDLGLIESMSVMENIALTVGYRRKRSRLISWKETYRTAKEVLAKMDCAISPEREVATLSAAEKSIVAIARALAGDAKILILDEPTATLGQRDAEYLFSVMRKLRDQGIALIFVTHRLDEVFETCDRVTVLRDGHLITSKAMGEVDQTSLVHDIVGREVENVTVDFSRKVEDNEVLLKVRGLETSFLHPVSLDLHRGEVLALYGVRGAGHHEVGRCLWGIEKARRGTVEIGGKAVQIRSPQDAERLGIGFVSSKRLEEGIAEEFPVRENLYINPDVFQTKWIDMRKEAEAAEKVVRKYHVKTVSTETPIGNLSGGNQQKVCAARWIEAGSDILILEEPTIGVDVGAKAEIYMLIEEMLKQGKAVLLISSDYEEVCKIAHRVLIFSKGVIESELKGREICSVELNRAAAGCA